MIFANKGLGGVLKLANYRFYRLDGAGKISAADWIEADHDQGAVAQAQARMGAGSYELWDGERLVARSRAPLR